MYIIISNTLKRNVVFLPKVTNITAIIKQTAAIATRTYGKTDPALPACDATVDPWIWNPSTVVEIPGAFMKLENNNQHIIS